MPGTANPNAGLTSGWADGEGGWGGPMNTNLATADSLLMPGIRHARAYGAKGDNVTDDKAAIQLAIDACAAGESVYVARGTYLVSGALTIITSNVTF